ncbi:MAG: 1-acyl-sn-glycerol-3-phosphate acyltransferase [Verrucomicrobiota bacterium]|nr:1-acyl-sn-glycerol-3-phosphate acyltransferase [Verrucomicrobiota bacterium]
MIKSGHSAALALERKAVERLRRFPRERDALVDALRPLLVLLVRGLMRVYLRFEIVGKENLPNDEDSFVMLANHSSHLDSVCLLAALPLRRLPRSFPVAAEDYFFRSLPRTWFAAVMMNALPFGRQMRVRESLSICRRLLAQPGNVLLIFPEGTRSRSGQMQSFKPGIGSLLAGRPVNVVPCYVEGAFRVWPKGRRFPRPRKVRLIIGGVRQFAGDEGAAAIAAELQTAVEDLSDACG